MQEKPKKSETIEQRPLRLLKLKEACERRGISPRTWADHPEMLPPPIRMFDKPNAPALFVEHEVDEVIRKVISDRDAKLITKQEARS